MATKAKTLSELLRGQQYCLLTTYRKDGTPVPTPMWFAVKDETVYMYTKGGAAKVRRMRREPKVTIGACDANGRGTGPQWDGLGQVLDNQSEEAKQAEVLLSERYGIKRRLLLWGLRFAKDKSSVHLAVRLA